MNQSGKLAVPSQVLAREVGEEIVILDLASGMYFGLDAVGARIWRLISEGATFDEVCARLTAEYEVDADAARRDARRLIDQLTERGLLAPAANPAS